MLLDFAIGDCYGRTFEFQDREFIKANNNVDGYKNRESEEQNGIGIYTDDTQMMLAVAETMLDDIKVNTQIRYAHHFVSAYKRDIRGGYSKRIKSAMDETNPKFPFEFLMKNSPAGFKSNGSVMRTVPLGLYDSTDRIVHECMVHTSATHGSMEAFNAAIAVSLTAHYLYHVRVPDPNPVQDLLNYQNWMKEKMGVVYDAVMDSDVNTGEELPCDAMRSAAASIRMVWENDDPRVILWRSVERGGDVDTLAAVSLGLWRLKMIGNSRKGWTVKELPQVFLQNMENQKYGRDYIAALDQQLLKKFPSKLEQEVVQ